MAHRKRQATTSSGHSSSKRFMYCPHCDREVGKSTFYEHKSLYYDFTKCVWKNEDEELDDEVDQDSFVPSTSQHIMQPESPESFVPSDATFDMGTYSDSDSNSDHNCEDSQPDSIEIWAENDVENDDAESEVTSLPYIQQRLIKWYAITLFTFQCIFSLSDAAMGYLFSFFAMFLATIAKCFSIPGRGLVSFASALPSSVQRARTLVHLKKDNFKVYASCPKCDKLYDPVKCVEELPNKNKVSKLCTHIEFPCHPQRVFRQECKEVLMKQVRSTRGNVFYYPRRSFCYHSIVDSLSVILAHTKDVINHWKQRSISSDTLADIYDGNMWEKFVQFADGYPSALTLSLTLNVDWFQPFDHTTESVGAIYMVINNLPRHLRFKQQNVILVGLIPGPHEPHNMTPYLDPLVEELKKLSEGVIVNDKTVRALLLCVSNDIPAARKLCGFAGTTARLACTKCKKTFPTASFGDKPDYSGYDVHNWPQRSDDEVRTIGLQFLQAKTKQKRKDIVREHGCRYSLLHEVPNLSVVKSTVVDPMHNLFLGTAKHTFEKWVSEETGLLSSKNYPSLQSQVDVINMPRDIGRIPHKIASGFSGFTADQWRIWTVILSSICLYGILPTEHLECWRQFVIACALYTCKVLTVDSVSLAHDYVLRFCRLSTILYNKQFATLNMHLHCHLKECILDYGPVHSFWLFSFERYNGILGDAPNNHRNITLQLMRRFLQFTDVTALHENLPDDLKESFSPFLHSGSVVGSVMQTTSDPICKTLSIIPKMHANSISNTSWEASMELECLQPTIKERALDSYHLECLNMLFHHMYGRNNVIRVNRFVLFSNRATVGTMKLSSRNVSNSAAIMAVWGLDEMKLMYGEVELIITCTAIVKVDDKEIQRNHNLAIVRWFRPHPTQSKLIGFPWILCENESEGLTSNSFIPLSRIMSRCASATYKLDQQGTAIAFAPVDFIYSDSIVKLLKQYD